MDPEAYKRGRGRERTDRGEGEGERTESQMHMCMKVPIYTYVHVMHSYIEVVIGHIIYSYSKIQVQSHPPTHMYIH